MATYRELATGKTVQASKGYMSNHGGLVVREPDAWVILRNDGVELRSEDGFRKDYEESADKPKWDIHFDPELGDRGQYVMMDYARDLAYRIDKDAAEALIGFVEKER